MKIIFLFALFLIVGNLSVMGQAVDIGLSTEINGNSREGTAIGAGLFAGYEINKYFTAGFKTVYHNNFDTLEGLDLYALGRGYLPLKLPDNFGMFLQADLGTAIYFEFNKSYPAFLAGLTAGLRFLPGKNWYIETALRAGYPFLWGASITGGMRINFGSNKQGGLE